MIRVFTRCLLAAVAAVATASAGAAPLASAEPPATAPSAPYSLLQMNLCLSGFAGCFPGTAYPSIVDEAIDVINAHHPNAVTVNEACSGDIARIAQETGYHMRFATVLINAAPLECRTPGGRGVFGNAVMTKEAIKDSADRAFTAQAGSEERRWICAATARGVNVCTTHLSTRGSAAARAANDGQCAEFAAILAEAAATRPTIATGDTHWLSLPGAYAGLLTVGLCAYLAAVYLTWDARRLAAGTETAERFRRYALGTGSPPVTERGEIENGIRRWRPAVSLEQVCGAAPKIITVSARRRPGARTNGDEQW